MERWVGKVALVTGASAGIGEAVVLELLNKGLKVVGVARRVERIEELKKNLPAEQRGNLYPLKCDLAKEEDIVQAFQYVKETFGAVHVLVNNAGVVRYGRLSDGDPQYWRDILDVNVMGLCLCTKYALKLMHESGVDDGQIIHINSICGHVHALSPDPIMGMYIPSKWAVTAINETHRQELKARNSKIKVTSLSPGFTETEIIDAAAVAIGQENMQTAREVFGPAAALKAQDVADGVTYILSTPPRVQVHELTLRPLGGDY